MLQSIEDQVKQDYWSEWEQICFSIKRNGRNMNCRREVGAPAPTLSGIGFLGRRPHVPVGAGEGGMWCGDPCGRPSSGGGSHEGDHKGCRLPRRPSPTQPITTPAPTGTRPLPMFVCKKPTRESGVVGEWCGIPSGQYISNKRFSRKARGCKSTSVGADLSRPPPIYRPSLAVPLSALFCEKPLSAISGCSGI